MLQVTLPTNFKVARFDRDEHTAILRQLEDDIEAVRFDTGDGKIELPVKLKVHDSIFVPLAKWAMLLTGNYRCVTKDGMRTASRRRCTATSRRRARSTTSCDDLCVKLGAAPDDLVPFEKYAAAAQGLTRPSSAARALQQRRAQHRARRQAGAGHRHAEGPEPSGRSTPAWRWSMSGWPPTAQEGGGLIRAETGNIVVRRLRSSRRTAGRISSA